MAKILIVDDSLYMREVLRGILTDAGHHVMTFDSGEEAIAAFEKEAYDMVMLDIVMPLMDGITILRRIKKMDPYASVIMCSAWGSQYKIIEALKEGAKDFIVKPFTAGIIKEIVHKNLELAEQLKMNLVSV